MLDRVSDVYARAFLESISEDDQKKLYEDMLVLRKVFSVGHDVRIFLYQSNLKMLQKVDVLVRTFELSDVAYKILRYIVYKKRILRIESLTKSYVFFYEEKYNIKRVTIITASELNDVQVEKMIEFLKDFLKTSNILLDQRIDKGIIGGSKFVVDGRVYDNTIKRYLNNLKEIEIKEA